MEIRTIGIDLGKTVFHLVGVNARGEVVVRKKCSRTPYCRQHDPKRSCRYLGPLLALILSYLLTPLQARLWLFS